MAGRRNRRSAQGAKVESAEESPTKTSSSSSGGSTGRTSQRKAPFSRLHPQPEEEENEAWTLSDKRDMRRRLLDIIHRYYLDAISRLPPTDLRTTLARGLLVGGHCFGPFHPVHNIIFNSLWYSTAYPLEAPIHTGFDPDDDDDVHALLSIDGIVRICYRSLDGLLASLRHCCPSLSTGDALWQLFAAGADFASAIALANGTSKSGGLRVMSSHGLAAFHLGAQTGRHPNPSAFAQFASLVLPDVNGKHNIVQLLLMRRVLSTEDVNHLSNLLGPALPNEPAQPPLILSSQVLDRIVSQKKQFKETGKQVLSIVDMALQEHHLRSAEQLMLHSICGASLLEEQGPNDYYHINFWAYQVVSGSGGVPVLFFAEATIFSSDGINILLCVPVDPVADIGCCFACETNKKKIVHPFYDKYHGGREFQVDEVDNGNDLSKPVDVDYIFFDACRDRAFANYLDDSAEH